jgi:hypothetical protein
MFQMFIVKGSITRYTALRHSNDRRLSAFLAAWSANKGATGMTVQDVTEVLSRARDDPEFRRLLRTAPDRALHGYDIEPDERAAIISGDVGRLEELGVSEEFSELAPNFKPTRQDPTLP